MTDQNKNCSFSFEDWNEEIGNEMRTVTETDSSHEQPDRRTKIKRKPLQISNWGQY